MSTYKGVVEQLDRTAQELPALTRSVGEAVSELASAEAKSSAASHELEARSALVRALRALDAELARRVHDRGPGADAQRRRRAEMAKKLAALRSIESDAGLEDREAWALSLVELARARVGRAVSHLDASLRRLLEGGALRMFHRERSTHEAAASRERSAAAA